MEPSTLMTTFYVSQSQIPPADADSAVHDIVAKSISRNRVSQITGALMFTGEHFVQVLEGRAAEVDPVMDSIRADPRHDHIVVMAREKISERLFSDWDLAYSGPSRFVIRNLERLRRASSVADRRQETRWLRDLLLEFARHNDSE